MSVTVTKTSGHTAEITWVPESDDARGYIAKIQIPTDLIPVIVAGNNNQPLRAMR